MFYGVWRMASGLGLRVSGSGFRVQFAVQGLGSLQSRAWVVCSHTAFPYVLIRLSPNGEGSRAPPDLV